MFQRENSWISNIFAPKKIQIWNIMQLFDVGKTFAKKFEIEIVASDAMQSLMFMDKKIKLRKE